MIRKTIFWTHLVCGVLAGAVILTMSFTGVVLTYERQIEAWVESLDYVQPADQGERLALDQVALIARTEHAGFEASLINVKNDPGAPVVLSTGGRGARTLALNPYSGEEMEVGSEALSGFFGAVTGFHRWFNMEGEARNTARAITGASNLAFLFLVLSGIYLWLPRVWKWAMFRGRLLFAGAPTAKARDFNWHHVYGIWSAIPLAVVVATGSVFYYPWANDLVYLSFGEEPPGRAAPAAAPQAAQARQSEVMGSVSRAVAREPLPLDELFGRATAFVGEWRTIGINLPKDGAETVSFAIDQGNGGQPHLRHTLSLDRFSGEVAAWEPFSSQTPGRQARSIVRYLHTGEALGIMGQTIAGLVSFTSLLMVWTGLALAWRRLIQPLFRRNGS